MASSEIDFTTLLDWLEGRLDATAAHRVGEAVAVGDAETRETVAWIEEFLESARVMPLQAPPAELSARLRDVFTDHTTPYDADATWSAATLLHDTRQPRAAAGMRSSTAAERVNLAFDSEIGRFVLELSPFGKGTVDVSGLVALRTPDASGVNISFLRRGELCRAVRPTSDGRFEARAVPEDVDELRVVSGPTRVRAALDLARST